MPPSVVVNKSEIKRVSMMLWGSAGCGKTTLANTAPGKRLYINFDPDGTSSLPLSDDTLLLDYSAEPDRSVDEVKSVNPFGLEQVFKDHPDINTVIFDSVTAFATKATAYSVGHKNAPGAAFENPSMSGYGFRNRFTLGLCKSLLYITGKHNKNLILVCHEDVPKTNDKGEIQRITILLGGSLPEEVPLQISEVWHMRDTGTERRVTVRSSGLTKPMKSRMFDTTGPIEFVVSDKVTPSKVTLTTLFDRWRENKFDKIKVPS
jgi:hypothetical protein